MFGAPDEIIYNENNEPVEEGYYDEEASEGEVKRNKRRKYEPDD